MLNRVLAVTLFANLCLITVIVSFAPPAARADMGMFPAWPDVSVYEPGQKAIIAWNGGKETMILSTDANASQETRALRVLPLPSMPQIEKGSFSSFEVVQRLINFNPYIMGRPAPSTIVPGEAPPAVEILFHERIGAHDITVVKANDYEGFVEWARGFVGEEGFSLPQSAEPVIEQYIVDDVRYFVFDIVELTERESSIEPIIYEFETPDLYYPLVISTLIPGETKIDLFILTKPQPPWWLEYAAWPLSLAYYRSPGGSSIAPMSFEVNPLELVMIDPGIAGLFGGESAWLTVLEYEGPLGWLTRDLKLLVPWW